MLLNDFFYIDALNVHESHIDAEVRINPAHEILKGHFPEQAVVPGVCMIEMLKETIEIALNKSLQLESSSVVKFLSMLAPPQFTQALFVIKYTLPTDNTILVDTTLQNMDNIFMKFKGVYIQK